MIFRQLRRFSGFLLDCLYPCQCLGCGKGLLGYGFAVLCPECEKDLELIDNSSCGYCGAPAGDYVQLSKGCAFCDPASGSYTRAVGVVRYNQPAREIIHDFKFRGNSRLASLIVKQMLLRLQSCSFPQKFDLVIPVPLHKKRYQLRGYNQSELLARKISQAHDSPLCTGSLKRIRNTKAQSLLEPGERRGNIAGAFAVDGDLTGKSVLLVDDVMTTGATVNECARVLREAGCARIYVCVWAR